MKHTTLRNTVGALSMMALTACMTAPITEGSDANAIAVSADQLLATADGQPVELLNSGNRGFILNADNTITYVDLRSTGRMLRTTDVVSNTGNQICMERLGNWSGACLDLYRMSDGTLRVDYEFGNGHGGTINVR